MLKFFKDKRAQKQLLFAVITLFMLFFIWFKWLNNYTNHNDVVNVPDFDGIHIKSLDSLVDAHDLRYEIIDSIFDKSKQKGVVVNQDPLPNTKVKENRKIYLTINSLNATKVKFPDVVDLTLRQAVSKLEKNGFDVGELEYRADIAENKVLICKVNGIAVKFGQELYYGTTIDLVVGQGLSNEKVAVPNLIGLSRIEANSILQSVSLNVGLESFNNQVSDSNSAIIYKQYPEAGDAKEISIGSSIDLYFQIETDSL